MKSKSLLLYESTLTDPSIENVQSLYDLVADGTEKRLASWDLSELGTPALWAELRPHEEVLLVDLYKPDCIPIKRVRSSNPKNLVGFENGVCLQLEPDRIWVPQYISFSTEYSIPKELGMSRFKRIAYFEL